jgi:hypothetical protein
LLWALPGNYTKPASHTFLNRIMNLGAGRIFAAGKPPSRREAQPAEEAGKIHVLANAKFALPM